MNLKLSSVFYYFAIFVMIIFFIVDGLNKYLDIYGNDETISIYFRFFFQLIFVLLTFLILTKKVLNLYIILFLILTCFLIGQGILIYKESITLSDFLLGLKVFNKFIFSFLLFPVLDHILLKDPILFKKLVKSFYLVFIANIIIVLIGFVLDSELVRSYPLRERFGYSGLIPKRNEATLFYMLGLSIGYIRFVILKRREFPVFFIAIVGSLVLGTKGIYLFLIFLALFHIRSNQKLLKNLAIGGVITGIFLIAVLPNTEMYSYYYSQYQRLGFITMISSGRDIIFFNEISNITSKWNILNVFVGGQNQSKKIFEMDFLDLFFFLGLLGGTLYLWLYKQYFFKRIVRNEFQIFFMISYFFLAFFGGHFFASAVNGLYFVIVSLYIFKQKLN